MAVAAGAALSLSSRIRPKYEAKAKVFVGPRSLDKADAAGAIQELTFSQEFVASYAEMLKGRPLAERVVEKTNAGISGAELAKRVETKIVPETRLIEVTVTDHFPERAELYANELVNTFVSDPDVKSGGTAISASVFEPAIRPLTPKSPKPLQNGLIAGFLGGLLGVSVAFLMERLDTAIRSKEDLEKALAPLPVIAEIPLSEGRKTDSVFVHDQPDSPQAEALRILRTNVQFFSVDKPVRKALVTSPFAGDGKTTVASNLAASMAAVGSTVLLLETDLRKPVLHDVLQVKEGPGLSNVLAGQVEMPDAVQRTRIPNLYVMTAGTIPPNPSELLGSEKMVRVIAQAEVMAEIVVLDSPPALPVTDAAVLAPHTDGVILVVRSGRTPTEKAVDVVKNFTRHDVRMLGVVLNGIERDSDGAYYYQYRHYRAARAVLEGKTRGREKATDAPHISHATAEEKEFLIAPRKPAGRPLNHVAAAELGAPQARPEVQDEPAVSAAVANEAGNDRSTQAAETASAEAGVPAASQEDAPVAEASDQPAASNANSSNGVPSAADAPDAGTEESSPDAMDGEKEDATNGVATRPSSSIPGRSALTARSSPNQPMPGRRRPATQSHPAVTRFPVSKVPGPAGRTGTEPTRPAPPKPIAKEPPPLPPPPTFASPDRRVAGPSTQRPPIHGQRTPPRKPKTKPAGEPKRVVDPFEGWTDDQFWDTARKVNK